MGKWHGSCSSDEAIEHALPQRGVRMESSVYQRARQEWDERYATGQRTRAGSQSTPAFGDNAFCSDCVAERGGFEPSRPFVFARPPRVHALFLFSEENSRRRNEKKPLSLVKT